MARRICFTALLLLLAGCPRADPAPPPAAPAPAPLASQPAEAPARPPLKEEKLDRLIEEALDAEQGKK